MKCASFGVASAPVKRGDCDHEDDQTDQRHALQERVLLLFEGQQRERHGGKPE